MFNMHSVLDKTPRLVERQLGNIRNFCCSQRRYGKKLHWAKAAKIKTNVDRALEHYDDFYATVFKNKWPSMRLALLCEPKYLAFPNTFTGDVERISESLESLGGLSLEKIWSSAKDKMDKEKEALDSVSERERLQRMQETLEQIAKTKKAEELEVLYQNAPKLKLPVEKYGPGGLASHGGGGGEDSRVMKNISDASQEFITETKLKGVDDFVLESDYYSFYADSNTGHGDSFQYTTKRTARTLKLPPLLRPYTFEPGNPSLFPAAAKDPMSGLREFICVNGASLAPIIALDLHPGVSFVDLCSGPGTKSLLALMTTCPSHIVCNDVDAGRLSRVRRLMTEFTGSDSPQGLEYTRYTATNYPEVEFSRVLADVPCSQDRSSCTVADNNIFKSSRTRERLGLVNVQKQILLTALRCLKPEVGSTCVYSTCTLSPIENDGAVGAALNETPVTDLYVDVIGLWNALVPLQKAGFFFMTRTKFGVLIEPNVISNFGPMYISRIVRIPQGAESVNSSISNNNNNNNNVISELQ